MSQVLVTGASGYVGTQLIAALLRGGSAAERSRCAPRCARPRSEDGLRAAVRRGSAGQTPTTPALRSSPPT